MFGIVLAIVNTSACSCGAERGGEQRAADEAAEPGDDRAGGHHRAGGQDAALSSLPASAPPRLLSVSVPGGRSPGSRPGSGCGSGWGSAGQRGPWVDWRRPDPADEADRDREEQQRRRRRP